MTAPFFSERHELVEVINRPNSCSYTYQRGQQLFYLHVHPPVMSRYEGLREKAVFVRSMLTPRTTERKCFNGVNELIWVPWLKQISHGVKGRDVRADSP